MTIDRPEQDPADLRSRIIAAASKLIAGGGNEAATTRAVALGAGVQPPAIYRLFGDKTGLLAAVAQHELTRYFADKDRRPPHPDPVEDLKIGWDGHVGFCLANPGLFAILNGETRGHDTADLGMRSLRRQIRRIAMAGRLVVPEDRAVSVVHATGTGIIVTLLSVPAGERDMDLSDYACDMVVRTIARTAPDETAAADVRPQATAVTLKAALGSVDVLSPGERHLLEELLERIALMKPSFVDTD